MHVWDVRFLKRCGDSRFWKSMERCMEFPFAKFLRILVVEMHSDDFALLCWLAWKLWSERNRVIHGVDGSFLTLGWLASVNGEL